MREDEFGQKQPELFDLHVMLFADPGAATVVALQNAFSLDAASAERLVAQTPIVVKRAATPAVAAALLDALVPLGAQVVLLPSTGASLHDPDAPAAGCEGAGVDAWGGLELRLPEPRAVQPTARESQERGMASDVEELRLPVPSAAPEEFELQIPEAPAAHGELALDLDPELPPLPDFDRPLDGLSLPPLAEARHSAYPPGASSVVPSRLSLGTVPPLPPRPNAKVPPLPPLSSGRARALTPERTRSVRATSSLHDDAPPTLPSPPQRSSATSAVPRATGEARARRTSRRSLQKLELDAGHGAAAKPERAKDSDADEQSGAAVPARKQVRDAESHGLVRGRTQPLSELLVSLFIVGVALVTNHSVFLGDATLPWVGLHGLAFFGIGRGVLGLVP